MPAQGWLVGEVHDGIAQMFKVIEHARMFVGAKAIATLSAGYQVALDYAKNRVQGADLTATSKDAPRVTITHHPDVRRSLMLQKAYAEGMRALYLYTASFRDQVIRGRGRGRAPTARRPKLAERVNDLLLPIVKGFGSERATQLLTAESLQTLGGSGYLQDYPIEQYIRDSKIDTLYEGTTAIQGQDFFFRKIVKDGGVALTWLAEQIQATIDAEVGNGRLKEERALLATALSDVQGMLTAMFGHLTEAQQDMTALYKVAPEHQPPAAGRRRPDHRLAAGPPVRGGPGRAGRRGRARRTGSSTRASWPPPGSSPPRCCRACPRSGRSSRTPTTR